MMAGGEELQELGAELEEFSRSDAARASGGNSRFEAGAAAEHAMAEALKH